MYCLPSAPQMHHYQVVHLIYDFVSSFYNLSAVKVLRRKCGVQKRFHFVPSPILDPVFPFRAHIYNICVCFFFHYFLRPDM